MIHLVSSGDAGDDGFLAAEVSVESHGGDVSGLGNLFHGHTVKTIPGRDASLMARQVASFLRSRRCNEERGRCPGGSVTEA